jgi:CheY-like chemotaxis protein
MPEALHIVLADDDADDRLFFTDALSASKIQTVIDTVNDGVELMDYLRQRTAKLPDLIFLDLNMPRKGGMECLAEIRRDPKLNHLAVAIYSTSSAEKDIDETFIKGANIYIRKPSDFQTLKQVIADVLGINWQYRHSGLNRENFLMVV